MYNGAIFITYITSCYSLCPLISRARRRPLSRLLLAHISGLHQQNIMRAMVLRSKSTVGIKYVTFSIVWFKASRPTTSMREIISGSLSCLACSNSLRAFSANISDHIRPSVFFLWQRAHAYAHTHTHTDHMIISNTKIIKEWVLTHQTTPPLTHSLTHWSPTKWTFEPHARYRGTVG
jgi:hypothetical protein